MEHAEQALGKILPQTFERTIWTQNGACRPEVSCGPEYGVDVSLVNLAGGWVLASASDPLSLIPGLGMSASAWLSVHLTANDLATTGYAPMYGQFVLNLPTWVTDKDFAEYWSHIHDYCLDIGLSITGGHTGKIPGQESTIAGGATFSLVAPEGRVMTSKGAKPGQCLLITKGCGISATAILARSFPETVKKHLGEQVWKEACELLFKTSVLPEGLASAETGVVSAMHDVTEGGVLGAVYELCCAAGCGAIIDKHSLAAPDAVRLVATLFGYQPENVVGAGAMLIACDREGVSKVKNALAIQGIPTYLIGETRPPSEGILLSDNKTGRNAPITQTKNDPYWGIFFDALKKGWK